MTPRKDILDEVQRAMEGATPRPNLARKAEVMASSLEVFEAQQRASASPQPAAEAATAPAPAPAPAPARATPILGRLRTRFAQIIAKPTGRLTAATAVLASAILILGPQGQELLQGAPSSVSRQDPSTPRSPSAVDDIIAEITAVETPFADTVTPDPFADAIADSAPASAPSISSAQTRQILPSGGPDPSGGPSEPEIETMASRALPDPSPALAVETAPPSPEDAPSDAAALSRAGPTAGEQAPATGFAPQGPSASYANLRSTLMQGALPAPQDVQIAEMINAFSYAYPAPTGAAPLQPMVQVFQTPWNSETQLVHISLQAQRPVATDRPAVNLVLLVDTSASMDDPSKLPLLVEALRQTLDHLTARDQIAIVTYAGTPGVALPPTSGGQTDTLRQALSDLQARDVPASTMPARDIPDDANGLEAAYALATQMTQTGEVSRILIATDGDFEFGGAAEDGTPPAPMALRQGGDTTLSVLHLGGGRPDMAMMQGLARSGNGSAAGADTLYAAQRVVLDHIHGAVETVAEGVELEVTFNPALIADHRQIGSDPEQPSTTFGIAEMRAGQSFTALYEVTPSLAANTPDDASAEEASGAALAALSVRWTETGSPTEVSRQLSIPTTLAAPDTDAQFATALARFGQLLRGDPLLGAWGIADTIALARDSLGVDALGERTEALRLMQIAQDLMTR